MFKDVDLSQKFIQGNSTVQVITKNKKKTKNNCAILEKVDI